MKKVIKLTEEQLVKIIDKVLEEQSALKNSKKVIDVIFPGQTAHGEIKLVNNTKQLVVTTENFNVQKMFVQTKLPVGKFMFELDKDGKRMFGYISKGGGKSQKVEIFPL